VLIGYDIDGVMDQLFGNVPLENSVVISGRTFADYDDLCKRIAQQVPLYIRGSGAYGDHEDAARFKALIINRLGVERYFEDVPLQAQIITDLCPNCEVRLVQLS